MATKADINADLTLEIDGRNVTPEKFMRAVRAFFGLVNEVTRDAAGPKEYVHWKVQVKDGSNLVGLAPSHYTVPPSVLDNIYAKVQFGIENLEVGGDHTDDLPEAAIRHVKDLGSVVGIDDADDTIIRVWTKKLPLTVTHKSVAHASLLLNEAYEDLGTIDGKVQVISDQGNLHVFVTEPIWGRRIRCFFDEAMLPKFMDAFRKRVEVKGTIKYRRDGKPISIAATGISEFPDSKNLPSFREMRGIFRERA